MITTREAALEELVKRAQRIIDPCSPQRSHEWQIDARADLAPAPPSADYVAVPKAGQNLMEVALWTELREAMIKDRPDAIKPPMSLGPTATAVIKRTVADYLQALAARPDQPARLVTVEDLKNWRDRCTGTLPKVADEIRAIIAQIGAKP